MDIQAELEVCLRKAGYETWVWNDGVGPTVCFENEAIAGFVYIFRTAADLLREWRSAQASTLTHYTPALRAAGDKAWNIYSVFIAVQAAPEQRRAVERIEEDLTQTRKIARAGAETSSDVTNILLPLLPIMSQPEMDVTDYEARLRSRLADISRDALTAFLGSAKAVDIARILVETQ